MFSDDDLLPISALQHLVFCERQWALIHLEGQWAENRLTVQGRHLHEKTHAAGHQTRGDLRIARGLRLASYRLGLTGQADVVEFYRLTEPGPPAASGDARQGGADGEDPFACLKDFVSDQPAAPLPQPDPAAGGIVPAPASAWQGQSAAESEVSLSGIPGLWRPFPVEYKRGKPKPDDCDKVQLCAQALCLEEMLGVSVPAGALFYGQPRRRQDVRFDEPLRRRVEDLAARLHELSQAAATPPARYEKKCRNCSLIDVCLPQATTGRHSARGYLADMLSRLDEEAADL